MKIIKTFVIVIVLSGILCCLLLPLTGFGGSLTTDNLNVNKDAAIYGKIILPGSSGNIYSNGMALSYSFSTNSSTQLDVSGNNNTGTVYSAIWTNGRLGSAYYFDGTNDYISASSSASLNLSTGLTVMAWVLCYTNADVGWDGIVCKGNASDRNYELGRISGNYACFVYMYGGTGRTTLQGARNICDGAWHLLAVTWQGSRFYLYVDGVVDIDYAASYGWNWSTPLVTNNLPLLIGKISDSYSYSYFNGGLIDEVRIHNYALSSQEVFNAYVSGGMVIENGSLAFSGNATVSGNVQANAFTGNGGGLTNLTAVNSEKLSGYAESEFVKTNHAGDVSIDGGVTHINPLGNLDMGIYTIQ